MHRWTRLIAAVASIAFLLPLAPALAIPGPANVDIAPEFEALLRSAPLAYTEALVTVDREQLRVVDSEFRQNHLTIGRYFSEFGVAYVAGFGSGLLGLLDSPAIKYVGPNSVIQYDSNTGVIASRAREVWDRKVSSDNPVTLSGGVKVKGTGVGVAVLDTGIDGTHPDLEDAMAYNAKYVCSNIFLPTEESTCSGNSDLFDNWGCGTDPPSWTEMPDTDEGDGHGTHVAGIVAGRGIASDGRFMGTAPGAMLWGLSLGPGGKLIHTLEAFNKVDCLNYYDDADIQVVTNSWSIGDAYSASHPLVVATNYLVSSGVVVVFSAGNGGPDGTVSSLARNPTQGVLSVASYDDQDTGSRTGTIAPSSSGCTSAQQARECPDIAAPGVTIVSTLSKTGAQKALNVHTLYAPYYTVISGTSMAAPHVAGVVALLRQANPDITPAEVEQVLEETATPFGSAGPYSKIDSSGVGFISLTAGHGLINVIAALEDERVLDTTSLGSDVPQVLTNPNVYIGGVINPMIAAGAPPEVTPMYTTADRVPITFSERSIVSGGSAWPLAAGQDCRFVVYEPLFGWYDPGYWTTQYFDCDNGGLVVDGTGFEAAATMTFRDTYPMGTAPQVRQYSVDPQVYFSGVGFVSIDSFKIDVVATGP